MSKAPKPTIVFALLGATFAALAVSSVQSFAASSCAADLRQTRTELSETPDSQQKTDAMGLYSAAMNASREGQDGQCLGDLHRALVVLAVYPVDGGSVGVNPASTSSAAPAPSHDPGSGDHHGHGHDHK